MVEEREGGELVEVGGAGVAGLGGKGGEVGRVNGGVGHRVEPFWDRFGEMGEYAPPMDLFDPKYSFRAG